LAGTKILHGHVHGTPLAMDAAGAYIGHSRSHMARARPETISRFSRRLAEMANERDQASKLIINLAVLKEAQPNTTSPVFKN